MKGADDDTARENAPLQSDGDVFKGAETIDEASGQMLGEASAPEEPVGMKKTPMKNASRERMKAETAFLRARVVELERELSRLMAKHALAGCAVKVPVWKDLARRHRARRQRAEQENDRLRATLLHQIQVAKSLETVFHNRAGTFFDDLTRRATLQTVRGQRYPLDDLAALHDQMMDEIDTAYPQVDTVFMGPVVIEESLTGRGLRLSTVVSKQKNDEEELYVELRDVFFVPYEYENVCRATWRAITTEYIRQNRLLEDYSCMEDVYTCSVKLESGLGGPLVANASSASLSMRKFVEENRMTIVWRCISVETTPIGSRAFGDEIGWLLVEPGTRNGRDIATIRVCNRHMPIWDDPAERNFKIGEFTNRVLSDTEEDIAAITESIENILLDESIGSTDDDLEMIVDKIANLQETSLAFIKESV